MIKQELQDMVQRVENEMGENFFEYSQLNTDKLLDETLTNIRPLYEEVKGKEYSDEVFLEIENEKEGLEYFTLFSIFYEIEIDSLDYFSEGVDESVDYLNAEFGEFVLDYLLEVLNKNDDLLKIFEKEYYSNFSYSQLSLQDKVNKFHKVQSVNFFERSKLNDDNILISFGKYFETNFKNDFEEDFTEELLNGIEDLDIQFCELFNVDMILETAMEWFDEDVYNFNKIVYEFLEDYLGENEKYNKIIEKELSVVFK